MELHETAKTLSCKMGWVIGWREMLGIHIIRVVGLSDRLSSNHQSDRL
jgi:hypothetical protein